MRQDDVHPVTFSGAAVVLHQGSSLSNREAPETDGVFDGVVGSLIGAVRLDFERGVDVPEVLDRDRLIVGSESNHDREDILRGSVPDGFDFPLESLLDDLAGFGAARTDRQWG